MTLIKYPGMNTEDKTKIEEKSSNMSETTKVKKPELS